MENALKVKDLTKSYQGFLLDKISFTLPNGFICGFIGQNGSGKTTTLKLLLNMVSRDGGNIEILGKSNSDVSVKEDLGILLDQPYFQEDWTPLDIEKAVQPFYHHWNSFIFRGYLEKFSLPTKQKYKTMSKGMKTKLGLAVALSHDAKILLLDEPTSGLDPVMRDEILEIFQAYIAKENKSIFFSTHITSDLEKIADYIVYISNGRVIYSGTKDELVNRFSLIRGSKGDLLSAQHLNIIGLREHVGGFEGMIEITKNSRFPVGVIVEKATLDDIMIYMNRRGV